MPYNVEQPRACVERQAGRVLFIFGFKPTGALADDVAQQCELSLAARAGGADEEVQAQTQTLVRL